MKRVFLIAAVMFAAAGLGVLATQPHGGAALAAANPAPLGDLSAMSAIVADVQSIAATGDVAAAEARITDLETAWDEAEPTMRPLDPGAWGDVDASIDDALSALRAAQPDAAEVTATLAAAQAELAHPTGSAAAPASLVAADGTVTVTDPNGRPVPCEDLAGALRTAFASGGPKNLAAAADLQAKGLERCNADDDARADAFFAEALAQFAP